MMSEHASSSHISENLFTARLKPIVDDCASASHLSRPGSARMLLGDVAGRHARPPRPLPESELFRVVQFACTVIRQGGS